MPITAEWNRRSRVAALAGALLLAAGCAAAPTAPTASGTASSTGVANLDSNVSFCTDEINRYRSRAGLAPLERSSALDGFSALAAEHDGKSRVPHQYFKMTNGGGVAMAENQLLLWKGYAITEVIRQGLAQMWAEGPSGSHYQILTGKYGQVGCGIYTSGSEVNVSQDFR
jgi:hypothetical protein